MRPGTKWCVRDAGRTCNEITANESTFRKHTFWKHTIRHWYRRWCTSQTSLYLHQISMDGRGSRILWYQFLRLGMPSHKTVWNLCPVSVRRDVKQCAASAEKQGCKAQVPVNVVIYWRLVHASIKTECIINNECIHRCGVYNTLCWSHLLDMKLKKCRLLFKWIWDTTYRTRDFLCFHK